MPAGRRRPPASTTADALAAESSARLTSVARTANGHAHRPMGTQD